MKIGQFEIGKHGIYTIAEIGKNHQGDVDIAKKLIDLAHLAGCSAVKFQAYHTEHLLHTYSESGAEPNLEWLKRCELHPVDFMDLKNYCDNIGITFLCTPESEQWVDVLYHSVHVPAFKVSSLNINNYRLLDKIAEKNLPVILSTGMSYMAEISGAFNTFIDHCDVALMHCVSQYPAQCSTTNLRVMASMREKYRVPIGFSDHTEYAIGAKVAAAAGAELLEFHITLDNNMEGPDHSFSLDPAELISVMNQIILIQEMLGDGVKRPHRDELAEGYLSEKRRCCVATKDIRQYEIITEDHIICLCPGHEDYVSAGDFYDLTSGFYEATKFIKKGTPIFKSSVCLSSSPIIKET
jgi:sialic acid synthase SpsE